MTEMTQIQMGQGGGRVGTSVPPAAPGSLDCQRGLSIGRRVQAEPRAPQVPQRGQSTCAAKYGGTRAAQARQVSRVDMAGGCSAKGTTDIGEFYSIDTTNHPGPLGHLCYLRPASTVSQELPNAMASYASDSSIHCHARCGAVANLA